MNKDMPYAIFSREHRGWWKTGGWGYTYDINEAGEFSYAKAEQICGGANVGRGPWELQEIMIPFDLAIMISMATVKQTQYVIEGKEMGLFSRLSRGHSLPIGEDTQ